MYCIVGHYQDVCDKILYKQKEPQTIALSFI